VAVKRFGNDAGKLPLFQKGRLPDLLTACQYGFRCKIRLSGDFGFRHREIPEFSLRNPLIRASG